MSLPTLLPVEMIEERLKIIFPEGIPNRSYVTRRMAARTIFVMLYIGAIEENDRWLAPKQVVLMSDEQAALDTDADRVDYAERSVRAKFLSRGQRWYADNTREPIRDETLREGLVRFGAALVRPGLPTTSSKPRYALYADFVALVDPALTDAAFTSAVERWQAAHLTATSLARIQILRRGAVTMVGKVPVTFPNLEGRQLEAGPSSIIAKAVVEEFAPRFLDQPVVILLSESGNKVIARDDGLINAVGLRLEAEKLLPDLILFDLSPARPLLVFVEVVASDGPISDSRKQALLTMAQGANYPAEQIMFVTAYLDRDHPAFKKTVGALAWQTFAWFVAEPDHIMMLREGASPSTTRLADLGR